MSKLENISALLVATNSAFTKEAAFTTKTTRAELIRMLQATDFAVSEALEVAENYVKVSDQLFEDKEKLSAEVQELKEYSTEVQELNDSHVMQLKHLHEKCSDLEAKLVDANQHIKQLHEKCSDLEAKLVVTDQQLTDCSLKNKELEFRVSEQQAELVATNKELADSKLYVAALQHQVHKYKQQGFFDRLFGRTPK